mmetsp:Transcript_7696/g.21749  ORF Transcript_7696/g.21749 Transcript_7696/m.21749 type:complete len:237 (+) Transcript_7696:1456-2166(+)
MQLAVAAPVGAPLSENPELQLQLALASCHELGGPPTSGSSVDLLCGPRTVVKLRCIADEPFHPPRWDTLDPPCIQFQSSQPRCNVCKSRFQCLQVGVLDCLHPATDVHADLLDCILEPNAALIHLSQNGLAQSLKIGNTPLSFVSLASPERSQRARCLGGLCAQRLDERAQRGARFGLLAGGGSGLGHAAPQLGPQGGQLRFRRRGLGDAQRALQPRLHLCQARVDALLQCLQLPL